MAEFCAQYYAVCAVLHSSLKRVQVLRVEGYVFFAECYQSTTFLICDVSPCCVRSVFAIETKPKQKQIERRKKIKKLIRWKWTRGWFHARKMPSRHPAEKQLILFNIIARLPLFCFSNIRSHNAPVSNHKLDNKVNWVKLIVKVHRVYSR